MFPKQISYHKIFFLFQDKNIKILCNSVPIKLYRLGYAGAEIHEAAVRIAEKYRLGFSKYSKCHNLMSSQIEFDEEKIAELGW